MCGYFVIHKSYFVLSLAPLLVFNLPIEVLNIKEKLREAWMSALVLSNKVEVKNFMPSRNLRLDTKQLFVN
ncbi:MAG: hypothetical protein FD122_2030 [Stygiobacter sp.]|nr:MAG: hypothetical protein FD122_2030 [Stygiobacter sp.]KAF0214500.1 MAG: hypothetical protein FD178_2374 [Ignavibacteria bacterium]